MLTAKQISTESAPPPIVRRSNSIVKQPITAAPPDIELIAAPNLIGTAAEKTRTLEKLNADELKKPIEQQVVFVAPEVLTGARQAADKPAVRQRAASETELIPAPINKTAISKTVAAKITEQQAEQEPEPKINIIPLVIVGLIVAALLYIFFNKKKR